MKKIFLFSILSILAFSNGFGQSKKNDLKLTVSALPLFGSSDGFESGINGIVIKPSIGYFISDKTSIDLNFSYATLNDLTVGNIDSYYNSYAFIPTLRNNFVNKEKLRVFAEFGFGLGTIKYDADNSSMRNSQHENLSGGISILNIGIGGNYFFNEKFGIELIIPYLSTKNITSDNSNNLYSGIGPTIGFTYILN
ncbi:hypothetical protein [Maribacter sp. 4G9]|uniref:hypothetical protein n=1 Tax=Maribacter sp. 4G9 TaxID=1889777 RepID=UPI000C15BA1A|nr:hypothetical protein [Maribacter sp. 4G9]PIB30921.1 hypothetical protein BFP75_01670 [Maribacter sp. 4G9]|tara:strand:- start:50 stop:634 length:585 start_codon:yes stop_codon:yes gene_type:complete